MIGDSDSERPRFLETFMRSVGRPDECWEWKGFISESGYGLCDGPAHRRVWELLVGPILEGLELDHLCRNTRCVNPNHLEPVTPLVNNMRSESPAARAARATACQNGHPWDAANTYWRKNWKTGKPNRMCRACRRDAMRVYAAARAATGRPIA